MASNPVSKLTEEEYLAIERAAGECSEVRGLLDAGEQVAGGVLGRGGLVAGVFRGDSAAPSGEGGRQGKRGRG